MDEQRQIAYQHLIDKLREWAQDRNRTQMDTDDPGTRAVLVLRDPSMSREPVEFDLDDTLVRDLGWDLQQAVWRRQRDAKRGDRIEAMARIMVDARRAGEDVGELVAEALRRAAERTYLGSIGLTLGRPGSWEASILRDMADAGGRGADPNRVTDLATLFVAMGQAGEDGGEVLSIAMGRAADLLGSVAEFADISRWGQSLRKLAGQHATVGDAWGPGDGL